MTAKPNPYPVVGRCLTTPALALRVGPIFVVPPLRASIRIAKGERDTHS
jgi:hypothetical protein